MLDIQELPVSEIKPAAYNPRVDLKPGDPGYDALKTGLEAFGLVEPLVWNKRTGNLVGGHQRFKILVARGETRIPVSVVDLDDVQEKALNLALNKPAGDWNVSSLADILRELESSSLNMELTGFSAEELERLLAQPTRGQTDEDAVPDPPKEPRAKTGDVWILGNHRLMCGDSTDKAHVGRLLAEVKPNLMVTDPPYGVNYNPEWREGADLGIGKRSKGKVRNDDRSDWSEAYALFPGTIAYVWHGGLHAGTVAKNLSDCGFSLRAQIIWRKQHFVLSRGDYHWQHEPCWYAVKKTGKWEGDRKQTTIWDIANNNSFGNPQQRTDLGPRHTETRRVHAPSDPEPHESRPVCV